jgi:hypothetical protein
LTAGIIMQSDNDPFFGYGVGMIITLKQLYLFSLIMIFVASLGNRPQASKVLYAGSFVLFAIIMLMMLYVVIDEFNRVHILCSTSSGGFNSNNRYRIRLFFICRATISRKNIPRFAYICIKYFWSLFIIFIDLFRALAYAYIFCSVYVASPIICKYTDGVCVYN